MELPDPPTLAAITERYARLLDRVAHEIGERPLVLPTGEFFPDTFSRDEPSAHALVRRMMLHAGLEDVPLDVRVVHAHEPEPLHDGGCSSGCAVPAAVAASAPRLADEGDRWLLNVPQQELSHSVVLTAMAARALGHVFLVETLRAGERVEPPADITADYAAVALGFGPILLEGAYIYSKGCAGPQIASVTAATIEELAVVTALFVEMGRHSMRAALAELGATQRALLSEALDVVKSNARVVDRLRKDPGAVASEGARIERSKPWLLRVLGKKPAADEPPAEMFERPKAPQKPRPADPAGDELRALVGEALDEARSEAGAE